jgi:hypothetical protein
MLFLLHPLGWGREKLVRNFSRLALNHPPVPRRDRAADLRVPSVAQFGLEPHFDDLRNKDLPAQKTGGRYNDKLFHYDMVL